MLREFVDKDGTAWRVWDVDPTTAQPPPMRGHGRPTPVQGWLCFESGAERRRLSPIPKDWSSSDADTLEKLCRRAEPVPRLARGFNGQS